MNRDAVLTAAAAAMGVMVWVGASVASGRREAWDGSLYWVVGMPVLIATAAALAWIEPRKAWRWAIVPYLAQFAAMLVMAEGIGLWPLGLVFTLVLALPALAAALGVAAARRGRGDRGP